MNAVLHEDTPPIGVRFHEYANLFPMLQGEALKQLTDDIRAHGVQEPIVFLDDYILDGRNRYMVARDLGIEYPRVEYEGDDPLSFVISHNLHRRHLTESQRASIAARLSKMTPGRPEINSANLRNKDTADMLKVSTRSVETARKVHEKAPAEIADAVDDGRISVSLAAKVADLPKDEQEKVIAAPPNETKKVARQAVKEAKKPEKPTDPYGYQKMTRDGLFDLANGLRETLDEALEKLAKADQTIEDLRADIDDLAQENQGATISKLQSQLRAAKLKRDDAMDAQKRAEYRLKKYMEEHPS